MTIFKALRQNMLITELMRKGELIALQGNIHQAKLLLRCSDPEAEERARKLGFEVMINR